MNEGDREIPGIMLRFQKRENFLDTSNSHKAIVGNKASESC